MQQGFYDRKIKFNDLCSMVLVILAACFDAISDMLFIDIKVHVTAYVFAAC